MKTLIWRLTYVYWMRKYVSLPIRFCWQTSWSDGGESFNDGMTPREAVELELSYWGV